MTFPNLRHSVRALLVDPDNRLLLCRARTPDGFTVWITPGGGIEVGETQFEALTRELMEEVGFRLDTEPPHVWHSTIVSPHHVPGFDGTVNDYYLIRTTPFVPRPTLTAAELALENLSSFRWWSLPELVSYKGPDLLGPRSLAIDFPRLLDGPVPERPVDLSPPR
ncbi:NUDIX domain-containing protein [Rhodococcus artemisiae]|uniref:NUDIX domain-containing protein n=1 Tax=Rhodococcus artemisiae TaxID=714159 RepID=A0ABU7LGZ0_9NOCA|nr:NUDIX domain-containing protein [Rhodococcus artemisiae]MEE2060826.1 NUDIX domain-containing protein [Rhodococcus artemisiae]